MWHTKASLLQYSYSLLYNTNSCNQVGTLRYFREKYNRKNVTPNKVLDSYDGSEELFISAGKSYIVAAFMTFFGMNTVDDYPTINKFVSNIVHKTEETKKQFVDDKIGDFVDQYIFQRGQAPDVGQSEDYVKNYALCVMFLTIVLLQLKDTAAEGDGDRNVINQKLLLSIFKSLGAYSKYAIEMFVSIAQIECLLTERMSEGFTWGFSATGLVVREKTLRMTYHKKSSIISAKMQLNAWVQIKPLLPLIRYAEQQVGFEQLRKILMKQLTYIKRHLNTLKEHQ